MKGDLPSPFRLPPAALRVAGTKTVKSMNSTPFRPKERKTSVWDSGSVATPDSPRQGTQATGLLAPKAALIRFARINDP